MRSEEDNEMLKDFGKLIREKRIRTNLTQEKVAAEVGITEVYLRDLENGRYSATWLIWLKICDTLELDIEKLSLRYIKT